MHYVGAFDESKFTAPVGYEGHSEGYERIAFVDESVGSVHMGFGICRLQSNGCVACCVHANEKCIYVIEGEVEVNRGGIAFRLSMDDYALIPYGISHAYRNTGPHAARWLEVQAPQPKPAGTWQDTFFIGEVDWPEEVTAPDLSDPRTLLVGHFGGEMPLSFSRPGTQGLAVNWMVNREFGAHQFLLMRGEIAVGGACGLHDHPVEESFFFLHGEGGMEIEGKRYHLRPGDFAWAGVGASHSFSQKGDRPLRWIETQAPQWPDQNGFRNYCAWDKLRNLYGG